MVGSFSIKVLCDLGCFNYFQLLGFKNLFFLSVNTYFSDKTWEQRPPPIEIHLDGVSNY